MGEEQGPRGAQGPPGSGGRGGRQGPPGSGGRGGQGPPGPEAERAQTPDGALPSRVTWRSRQLLTATVRELNTIGKEVLETTSAEQQVQGSLL